MINDIFPHKFNNSYRNIEPKMNDYILCFDNLNILFYKTDAGYVLPRVNRQVQGRFLFSIDNDNFFLIKYENFIIDDNYIFKPVSFLREFNPSYLAYAGICGYHLYSFFIKNKYCGVCGNQTTSSIIEHATCCDKCGNVIYPNISPAVIVGIRYENKILLTKYAKKSYYKYALVAGYTEVGETLEETVIREVFEEVGLRVTNVRYYKSQPWGFSNTMMIGFFADALDNKITLQESELKEATWFTKEEIELILPTVSLGHDMLKKMYDEL